MTHQTLPPVAKVKKPRVANVFMGYFDEPELTARAWMKRLVLQRRSLPYG